MRTANLFSALFVSLLVFAMVPFFVNQTAAQNADDSFGQPQVSNNGQWWQINSSSITVLFPAQGKKPMFLWYYNDNSSEVYSVKYRGLIEYLPLNGYYTAECEANPQTMQSLMINRYGMGGGMGMNGIRGMIGNAHQTWVSDFHPSFLPFSACSWDLAGPSQGTDSNGAGYVSFNFTLRGAPSEFGFTQNNVRFNCWFYDNQSTKSPHGLYSYTIGSGEMEMGFNVNDWSWNTNYMEGLFMSMHNNYGVTVPSQAGSLALWCDFGSINMQDLGIALSDANEGQTTVPENSTLAPTGLLEGSSTMTDIIAGGHQIHMQNTKQFDTTSLSIPTGSIQSYRMQFAQSDKTLPGFFNFANKAAIINQTTQEAYLEDTTAAYRTADNYMQLFICYPYFGSNTLEHDPSIGIDTNAQIISENPPVLFIVAAITILVVTTSIASRKIYVKNESRSHLTKF